MATERQSNETPLRADSVRQTDLILRAKIFAHRVADAAGRFTRGILSSLPLVPRALNLPTGRVPSLRKWVADYSRNLPWDQRRTGPHYRQVRRATRAPACPPPSSLVKNEVPAGVWIRPYEIHPELFLASIPNARLVGPNGIVITPDRKIAEESAWIGDDGFQRERVRRALRLPQPESLNGQYFTIASFEARGYAHWVLDALPRLSLLRYATPEARIIVSNLDASWQRDSLARLGVNLHDVMVLGNRHLELELLHVPSYIGQPGRIHPLAVKWLRKQFLTNQEVAQPGRRLYITRRGARRSVINEDELAPILDRFGFEMINPGELPFVTQVDLFSQAESIVGPHGAGLTNCVFAPATTKIFELFAPACVRPMYYQLSTVVGQSYWYLVGRESADTHEMDRGFDNMWISPEEFESTLADMFR